MKWPHHSKPTAQDVRIHRVGVEQSRQQAEETRSLHGQHKGVLWQAQTPAGERGASRTPEFSLAGREHTAVREP